MTRPPPSSTLFPYTTLFRSRGDWPSDINLHFNHLDVDSLLRVYLHGRLTGHSAVAGDLQLRGPLRKPHELNVAGKDRKSTRLNSSHANISYAVFCLKKKTTQ